MPEKSYSDELKGMTNTEFEAQEELLGKSLHLLTSSKKSIPIDSVEAHQKDWQARKVTDPTRLFNSICVEGLATPIKVSLRKDGSYHALTGRHRLATLEKIRSDCPKVWQRHKFDKGIPCEVYTSLNPQQELDLRTDEGLHQQPLADKVECFNALLPHYEAGRSDKEIQTLYWRIIVDTCCSGKKRSEIYEEFRNCINPKDFANALLNATRVHQQLFRALYSCPKIVRNQWIDGENGLVTEGKVAETLRLADLKSLAKAQKVDIMADIEQKSKHNYGADNPGPNVLDLLKVTLEERKAKVTEPKEITMSRADRDKHVEHSKSSAERIIFSAINGSKASTEMLDVVLNAIARYETADRIDQMTLELVIVEITKRGESLDDTTRTKVVNLIRNCPKIDAKAVETSKSKSKATSNK